MPPVAQAGNVLRPQTTLKLSLRLPPMVNGDEALKTMQQIVESDPPYHAKITFTLIRRRPAGTPRQLPRGWLRPWAMLTAHFGKVHAALGEGGSIPFMGLLGKKYPDRAPGSPGAGAEIQCPWAE